jgi:hypothetical protein
VKTRLASSSAACLHLMESQLRSQHILAFHTTDKEMASYEDDVLIIRQVGDGQNSEWWAAARLPEAAQAAAGRRSFVFDAESGKILRADTAEQCRALLQARLMALGYHVEIVLQHPAADTRPEVVPVAAGDKP